MVARSPAPIRSKPSSVPANDGFWPDNRNRAKDGREPAIEPNKQKTIGIVEVRPFRRPSSEHIDLLPQDQDFCFQRCSRLEERSHDAENQLEQILHQDANLPRLFSASMLNLIFGTHRRRYSRDISSITRKRTSTSERICSAPMPGSVPRCRSG